MKKRWLWLVFALMMAVPLTAQVDGESRSRANKRYMGIGIKGGVLLPDYYYPGNQELNSLPKDTLFPKESPNHRIRPIAGVQVEIPVGSMFYISPELVYLQRGDARRFVNIPSNKEILYTTKVNYLDLRIPFSVVIPIKGGFQPYFFGGVDLGMVMPYLDTLPLLNQPLNLSGVIAENDLVVGVNASNMAPFDAGVFAGAGGRYTMRFARVSLVAKLEVAYGFGLLNSFSAKELHSEAPAANLGSGGTHYAVGSRFNRGLECTFSLVLPLHFMGGDACSFGSSRNNNGQNGF